MGFTYGPGVTAVSVGSCVSVGVSVNVGVGVLLGVDEGIK